MLLGLILFNLLSLFGADAGRQRRYLVYPDGGPARAQSSNICMGSALDFVTPAKCFAEILMKLSKCLYYFSEKFIIGLGVPVDLKEQSVTVGTVIKFQYDLPTNSTEYTSRIYGFAGTVSRDMDEDNPTQDVTNEVDSDDSRQISETEDFVTDEPEGDNDTLVDLTFDDRRKRSLVYSEGGVLITDTTTVKEDLSLDEAIKKQEMIDQNALEEEEEPQRMNRWDFYKVIERMVERYGYSGRPCLLRTICEAAEVPFTHENGLLGEIGHILFTPSTTKDTLSHHTDNEYHAAERLGREVGVSCENLFPECEGSVLSTFTHIGEETLHKFGFL